MGLVRFALRNPHAVVVMALTILLIGVTSFIRTPADILPTFKTPAVQILTLYPGMPADVMEADITTRLERWTGQANGVARQESKSMVGVSVVRDFFRPDIDPNTAMSQVTSLAMSDLYYLPPGTIPPMVMPFDPTANIPLALLSVSSPQLDETALYDVAYFQLRNRLQGISGVIAPAVYGGKLRRILAYVDRDRLASRNLSPMDVVQAIRSYNLMIPTGNAKFGDKDYQINANSMVPRVEDINDFPVQINANGAPIFLKDVAQAEDTAQIQTNVVRINGRRQVYIPIYRQPGANTIAVVDALKDTINDILSRLPKGVNLNVVMDQSVYVREAIANLQHEGILGAALAALMVLLFLGSPRSTGIILISLPLSILAAFIGLYAAGQSINSMTLGGLALAVGLLMDQAIIVIENTHRHLHMGKPPLQAALEAAGEVSTPVLVITVTIVVTFFPVVFLTGIGQFLFTPLAISVALALGASYVLSMTVVPVCCAWFLKAHRPAVENERETARRKWVVTADGLLRAFDRVYLRFRSRYERWLVGALRRRRLLLGGTGAAFAASLLFLPAIGQELFPHVDAGQLMVRVRLPSGTRVEKTEAVVGDIEQTIREEIPARDLQMIISNIGVLYDWPAAYTSNSGPMDAFINLQFTEHRSRTAQEYAARLRPALQERFPGVEFSYDTGGLLTAALNFGLPSPINIQVEGNRLDVAAELAEEIRARITRVAGTTDVRIQQKLDYPQIGINVDRIKAAYLGLTQEDVVKNVVTTLNSSINFAPAFWIDHRNGNHYFIGAQYRESAIRSLETLENIPITGPRQRTPVLLKDLATFDRTSAPAEINHHNITRVIDIYANVAGRDVGRTAAEIERAIADIKPPEGYFIRMRGEVASMRESFASLGFGLLMAMALVYLVMVVLFRSFLDPLIVLVAVPLGLMGVLAMLFVTGTHLSIPALMGVMMMIGIAVSFNVLLTDLANRLRQEGRTWEEAIRAAASIRLRPKLMTALAAALGLAPMAVAGSANAPLARAVIGGVIAATVLTMFVLPALLLAVKDPATEVSDEG
ncbi:MAG: efflux RND transporter permease subunit [Armatimonadetes bacterium]|nr:efflux RND transporter permease subunit [Armatimonadota bacterium]